MRIWETVGIVWTWLISDVSFVGDIVGSSASRRSGLSRMRRVRRGDVGEVEAREDTAVMMVVFRCIVSSDWSV